MFTDHVIEKKSKTCDSLFIADLAPLFNFIQIQKMNLDLMSWQILLAQVMKMKMASAMCLNLNFWMSLPYRVTTFKCVSLRGKNKYRFWGKNSWDDLLGLVAVCDGGEKHKTYIFNINERSIM